MNNPQRIELIRTRLTQALRPTQLTITDESHLHAGHAGAKSGRGHFAIDIESSQFKTLSLVAAHRLIYEALGELMATDIHALRINVLGGYRLN